MSSLVLSNIPCNVGLVPNKLDAKGWYILLLPVALCFVVVAVCLGVGPWSLVSPVTPFVLYTSLSFAVFVLFGFAGNSVSWAAKFRLCLGGWVSMLVALFVNDLVLGLVTAADQRLSPIRDCGSAAVPFCVINLWLEIGLLVTCAIGEELWKLLAVRSLCGGVSNRNILAISGACVGFGFTILENISYFRYSLVGPEAWKLGLGRSFSALHVLLTALAATLASGGKLGRCGLAVGVCGVFHAANNVAVAVVDLRLQAAVIARVLVGANVAAVCACLYLCLRLK